MSSQDVIKEKKLEYLKLEEFWPIFCHSLSKDDDAWETFFLYLDEGVKLRYSELGYVNDDQFAHKGDIKCSLIRIRDHGSSMKDDVLELYTNGDGNDTSAPPHGLDKRLCKPVGGLLIKRSDIKQTYSKCGDSQYPWIIEPGNIAEWQWFPVDAVKSQTETLISNAATIPILEYGEPGLMLDDATRSQKPQAEAVGNNIAGSPADTVPVSTKVDAVFSKFKSLRANEVSLVVMNGGTAKLVIRGKSVSVSPNQLGLKAGKQGWKLLEGAAVSSGDLLSSLSRLNSSNNLESENSKIKTAVSRLRDKLIDSMGLVDDPIIYTVDNSYRFTFKAMTHELLKDSKVSKGADTFDYIHCRKYGENERSNNAISWDEDEQDEDEDD